MAITGHRFTPPSATLSSEGATPGPKKGDGGGQTQMDAGFERADGSSKWWSTRWSLAPGNVQRGTVGFGEQCADLVFVLPALLHLNLNVRM